MTYRHAPPSEISKTTLGAVIATIGATFLLIAALSHSWWTGTIKLDMAETEVGVGLAGLQRCNEVAPDILGERPGTSERLCVRLPFGGTYSKMKVPSAWAFFGRTTYYLSLLSIGLIVLSLGVLLGGNQMFARVTPARCAVISSGLALLSGIVFVILKPDLARAFDTPNMSMNAGFGMFMHIFGSIAAGVGSALVVLDAPQIGQPAVKYGVNAGMAPNAPEILNDTLPAPPPAAAGPVQPQVRPASQSHGQPPVAFYQKPQPPLTPACKQCHGVTRYIETFHKAFCGRCEVYTRMS